MGVSAPTIAFAQSGSQSSTEDLQNALRQIARNSDDSSALADAGLAALELGDTRAAIGFLAKADQIYPRSGRVKAGLGRALLEEQNPFAALRYFTEALDNGVSLGEVAADRGLAYDLIGRNRDAQKDYEFALKTNRSDELLSRYAISLGISGDIEQSDAKLDHLLQKSDRDAWRHRAFILAMNGKEKAANDIARQTMQRQMAKAIKPFFDRMPKLTAAQKAAAVHYGHFPASENIGVDVASVQYAANSAVRGGDGADAGLIPLGDPLGENVSKPKILAMPDTKPRRRPGKVSTVKMNDGIKLTKKQQRELDRNGFVKVSTTQLPDPEETRPLEKPVVSRPEQAVAAVSSQPAPAISTRPEQQLATAVFKPDPAPSPLSSGTLSRPQEKAGLAPGFETSLAVSDDARKTVLASAAVSTPAKPLVSETIERRVDIRTGNPASVATRVASLPAVSSPQSPLAAPVQESNLTQNAGINPAASSVAAIATGNGTGEAKAIAVPVASEPVEDKPVQLVNFDLAKAIPSQVSRQQTAAATPARRPLADIIGALDTSEEEQEASVVPVDLEKITPATPKPKSAPAKVEPKEPESKKAEPEKTTGEHPKRFWVQIATGSNLSALKYDYRRMAKKHGDLFDGNEGWTSPWGQTRRLVVGPFDDLKAAKSFEADFRKGGGDGFPWVSAQGTEVNKLGK